MSELPEGLFTLASDRASRHRMATWTRSKHGRSENVAECSECETPFTWANRYAEHLTHQQRVLAEEVWRGSH